MPLVSAAVTPLQQIAMGLVLVVLDTGTAWDVLADPLGWLLALPAVARLPADARRAPLAAGVAAALLSVLLWAPAGRDLLSGLDPSVDWLLLLAPDLVFGALLCWGLGRTARAHAAAPGRSRGRGGDPDERGGRAAALWPTLAFLFAVAALGPVPFLANDAPIPGDLASLAQLCWLGLIVLLFWWHNAPWAPTRAPRDGATAG